MKHTFSSNVLVNNFVHTVIITGFYFLNNILENNFQKKQNEVTENTVAIKKIKWK